MDRVASRLREIRFLIIDIDGVLVKGRQPLPGVPAFFGFLASHGIRFIIASNNSARPASEVVDKVRHLGIDLHPDQVLTSAQATAMYLPRLAPPGSRVFLVGGDGIAQALTQAGYLLVDRDADVVVAGADFDLTYEKLKRATIEITQRGAKFVGTNSDKTFPSEEGLIPGAGAIIAAIQTATGVTPTIVGKPERAMFDLSMQKMGGNREATAMLGDRLETDIEGAQRAGLSAILVLTGVTTRAVLADSSIRPDFVFDDLDELRKTWQAEL